MKQNINMQIFTRFNISTNNPLKHKHEEKNLYKRTTQHKCKILRNKPHSNKGANFHSVYFKKTPER